MMNAEVELKKKEQRSYSIKNRLKKYEQTMLEI